jgi:hypothetical protein
LDVRGDSARRSVVRVVGVVLGLTVWITTGASSGAATATAKDAFRAAVRATQDASSFVATTRQSGYHPPDSGDTGPVTLVYQAPDRFRSVQRLAGGPATSVTIVQIGHDHYEQDSTQPNVWTHHTLPAGEPGWGSFLKMLDQLAGVTHVSRTGDTYRLSQTSPGSTTPSAVAVAKVAHGHLVSLDVRVNTGPGKTQERTIRFSRFGNAPEIRVPTGNVQEGG